MVHPRAAAITLDRALPPDLDRALPPDLAPETRRRALDRAHQVSAALDDWARGHRFVRRERVVPLALSVAAAAPFADAAALASVARVSLWVFALDDSLDDARDAQHLPLTAARRRAARFGRVLRRLPTDLDDPFLAALAEVRDDLFSYPLGPALGGTWAAALRGTIAGMLREERWRELARSGADAWPSYAEYVANGRYSIGGPPHVWAS